jgi:hypothetical protein
MVSVGVVSGNRRSDDLRDMGTILRLRCISYIHREVVAIIICAPGTGADSAVEVRYTLGSEEY